MRTPIILSCHFLILIIFSALLDFKVKGQCLGHQKSLLLELKKDLIFDAAAPESNLLRWNQATDCCRWHGITCNEGRVTGLHLSNKLIIGGLTENSSLFKFQFLKSLDLSFNNFGTPIPSRFGDLTNLSYLNLSTAGFVGQIPIGISRLTNLVALDLSTSILFRVSLLKLESPSLATLVENLTRLEDLHLDGVNILAKRGSEWCQALSSSLPNLQVLSLSNCRLSGPLDLSLTKLQSLSVIRLDDNYLSTQVPRFLSNLSSLTSLSLNSCELYGTCPEEIFKIPNLKNLDMSNNPLLQGSLPEFSKNSPLQRLELHFTNFSGSLPTSIGSLSNLWWLDLSECQFNGTIPHSISSLIRLVHLDLSINNFIGPIPSFKMSKNLTKIVLSHNGLTGAIPSAYWEGLFNLAAVDLRNNFFGGTIPTSLFSLPSLENIQLSNNEFSGPLPQLQDVSSSTLSFLDLSSNNLEGPIPLSIFELRSLSFLSLASNKLNGTLQLDTIQRLGNLTSLDLSYNNLSIMNASGNDSAMSCFLHVGILKLASCNLREFPCLKDKSLLSTLDLSNNQIYGEVPSWVWKSKDLTHVNLSHNHLGGSIELAYSFNSLSILDLSCNQFQGKIPTLEGSFAVYIDFSNNYFTSSIPNDIGTHLSYTLFLSLSNNSMTGNIPESICSASNLQVLDLSHNSLSGKIPDCVSAMTSQSLGVLNLRNNYFSSLIPDAFKADCSLKTIDLSGNFIRGQVPKSLANCTTLEILDLGHNKMVGKFPCFLMSIATLRVVVLRSNDFYGHIGCHGTSGVSTMLQIIDLAHNRFSGKLPMQLLTTSQSMMNNKSNAQSELRYLKFEFFLLNPQVYYQDVVTVTSKGHEMKLQKILTIFTSVDLSSNYFEESIPVELGKLRALYILNLSNNALAGQIPSSLGNLRHLESLDLSWNNLSGSIPMSLGQLNFLQFLNFSFNHLVGMIPKGTQIQTFSEDSFLGNEALCGFPLEKNCAGEMESPKENNLRSESESDINWTLISALVGFIFGFVTVIWPVVFIKRWRIRYFERIDDIGVRIFPRLYQTGVGKTERQTRRR